MSAQNSLHEIQYGSDSGYQNHAGLHGLHQTAFDVSSCPGTETRGRKRGLGFSANEVNALWRHLHANLHSQISVREFSKVVGFSQWHFSRCFKVQFGCSPHRFIVEQRIRHAKGLLLSSRLTLADIALESGFADQAHLGRSFNQHVGLSPGRWRRKHRVHLV
jgi:transcriptional regulator GlxA family with amidase domain